MTSIYRMETLEVAACECNHGEEMFSKCLLLGFPRSGGVARYERCPNNWGYPFYLYISPITLHLPIPNSSCMQKKHMQKQVHAAGEGRAQQVPPSPGFAQHAPRLSPGEALPAALKFVQRLACHVVHLSPALQPMAFPVIVAFQLLTGLL